MIISTHYFTYIIIIQQNIKKMIITLAVFIISIQPVNANENKFDGLSQKFNHFFNCFKKHIETEVEETKEFQIKKWKEARFIFTSILKDYPNTSLSQLADKKIKSMNVEGR